MDFGPNSQPPLLSYSYTVLSYFLKYSEFNDLSS
jgi:hypothetical protein